MNTVLEILGLLIGFALLIKGADIFVDASVNISYRLKIPTIVVGLTIVALGTSSPEAVISISASLTGHNTMAVGNVIGSNIFNLLLVIGFCAMVKPIAVRLKEIARDYWVSTGAAVLLLAMMFIFNDSIPRLGGVVLLTVFFTYIVTLVIQALKNRVEEDDTKNRETVPLPRNILLAVFGIALLVAGGQLTVNSGTNLAVTLGITERIIGLTILAMGTSLPELIISLVACRKNENDIAIGNIVGSNIFNILFVLGISGIITPLTVDINMIFDLSILVISSLAFFLFAYTGKRVVRLEGLSLVAIYAVYLIWIIST